MVLTEDQVLHPLDPASSADSDSWPEFALRDVRVLTQDGRRLTSLFTAHPTQHVVVEAALDKVDRDLRHLIKHSRYYRETIRIRDVTMYSFSENEDGTLGFWAAGRAGWYELRTPAKGYANIFRGMEEGTGIFYYLADKYRNSRPRPVRDTVAETKRLAKGIIARYVNSEYSQRRDGDDALEGFYEHRRFLLRCMLEEQEGLDWNASAVFRYLKRAYPDEFDEMQELVASNGPPATESEAEQMDMDSQSSQSKRKSPRRPAEEQSTPKHRQTKPHSTSDGSDLSMDDELESAVRTHGRSVLRPRGTLSAKKYARHLAAMNPSENATDADADAEDGDESEEDLEDQDTPSKQAYLVGLKGGKPTEPVRAKKGGAASKPNIRAAYYENIGPGDVWTCPYDGCNERVYDAHSATAIRLMEEHFSDKHADSMTDLIKAEMRPYNKVGHLLSRVKDLAAIQSLTYDGAGAGGDAVEVGVLRQY